MIRILCPEPRNFSANGLALAARKSDLIAVEMDQKTFEKAAPDFDAVLIRFNTRIEANLLQRAPRLKAILSPTTGLDHIDMAAASRNGVKVFHLKGQKRFLRTVSATAELAVALMLAIMRNLPAAVEAARMGQWSPGNLRGREVSGKILGIIGCGRLGSKVARIGIALGMEVIAFDPFIGRFPARVKSIGKLRELLRQADVISVHVPLDPRTFHMLDEKNMSAIKKGAVLINTSRGAIIETRVLLSALESGRLSAAAVDVLENEESIIHEGSHPLIEYAKRNNNLLITPHIGGATAESVEKTDLYIIDRFRKHQTKTQKKKGR